MTLANIVTQLTKENFRNVDICDVEQILSNYGWSDARADTEWIGLVFQSVATAHKFDAVFALDDSMLDDLVHAFGREFGWPIDEQGEYLSCVFPISKMSLFVSREDVDEDGRGCCRCTVSQL